jgi:hypothetical protein
MLQRQTQALKITFRGKLQFLFLAAWFRLKKQWLRLSREIPTYLH